MSLSERDQWLEWRPVGCTCSEQLPRELRCGNRPIGWLTRGWSELVCWSAREASDRRRWMVGEVVDPVLPVPVHEIRVHSPEWNERFRPTITPALIPSLEPGRS